MYNQFNYLEIKFRLGICSFNDNSNHTIMQNGLHIEKTDNNEIVYADDQDFRQGNGGSLGGNG